MLGLKRLRKEKKLSLKEVAFAIGVTVNTVYNYEHGKRFPNRETLQKLADFFACTMDELIRG